MRKGWDDILGRASKAAAERVAPPPKGPLGVGTVRYKGWELYRDEVAKEIRAAFEIVLHHACPQCGAPSRWRTGVNFDHERICDNFHTWEPREVRLRTESKGKADAQTQDALSEVQEDARG